MASEANWIQKLPFAVQMIFFPMQSKSFVVVFDHAFIVFPAKSWGEVDSLRGSA